MFFNSKELMTNNLLKVRRYKLKSFKMKRKILKSAMFFGLAITTNQAIEAQVTNQNNAVYEQTFYGTADRLIEEALNQTPIDPNNGKVPASVKEIQRQRNFWGPRLYPHGDPSKTFSAYSQHIEDFNNGITGFCGEYDDIKWDEVGLNDNPDGGSYLAGTGQINRVTFSPSYNGTTNKTIFACSHYGGVYKSANGGNSWDILGTDLEIPFTGVADIAVDYANEDNLFIGVSNGDGKKNHLSITSLTLTNPNPTSGMYRSMDGGVTWDNISGSLLDDLNLGELIRRVVSDPSNSNVVLIGTTNGLYRCVNALSASPTWTLVAASPSSADPDIRGIEYRPGSPNIVYASGKHVERSIDGGATWLNLTGSGSGLDLTSFKPYLSSGNPNEFEVQNINIAVTPDNVYRIYAYVVAKDVNATNHNFAFIYIYDHLTLTWTRIDDFEATSAYNVVSGGWIGIAVSPMNQNAVYYGHTKVRGTPDYTNVSTPFKFQSPYSGNGFHADVHDLVFEPITSGNPKMYTGHHGGVSSKDITSNNSSGWSYHNTGLHCGLIWGFDNSLIKENQYILGCQDLGVSIRGADASNYKTIGGGDGYGAQIYNEEQFYVMSSSNSDQYSGQYDGTNNQLYNKYENSFLPYGHIHNASFKEWMPISFQVRYHPVTQVPIFGMNDLHERKKMEATNADSETDIWKSQSNLGNISGYEWIRSRRIGDFEIANSNPDYVYVVVEGTIEVEEGTDSYHLLKPGIFRSTNGLTNGDESLVNFTNITAGLPVSDYPAPAGESVHLVITGVEVDPLNEQRVWVSFSGFEGDKKVWYSSNAGATWSNYDPNGKLSNLPVNDIIYQKGSNDRIFAATDAGVYVKEPGVDWCRYGDIPNVRVMELKINPCNQRLIAGTIGRGLLECDIPSEDVVTTFKTITTNETWSEDVFSTGNIIIENGATLKILETLSMPKNGKIYVKRGGKLRVQGGTITNVCGSLWGGIEVWGNTSLSQFLGNQGEVIIQNHSLIEHAEIAVDCWKKNNWDKTGGIVKVYNSAFKNNKRSINMMKYSNDYNGNHYNNKSVFIDADFIWNDDFRVEKPLGHVAMYKVDGIYFTGCTFADDRNSPISSNNNVGIRSIDARYQVRGRCLSFSGCPHSSDIEDLSLWDPSKFENLEFGIYASDAASENSILVQNSLFENNRYGLQLVSLNSPEVLKCKFKFNQIDNNFTAANLYGIHAVKSTGIRFEENIFMNEESVSTDAGNTYGIVCSNLGETEEEVYKNEFGNLAYGIVTQGKNRTYDTDIAGEKGLRFLCNKNTNNLRDFTVLKTLWTVNLHPSYGVKGIMGTETNPTGNTFTQLDNTCEDIYHYPTAHSLAYYHNNALIHTPEQTCGTIFTQAVPAENTCPSKIPSNPIGGIGVSGQAFSQWKSNFYIAETQLQVKKSMLSAHIDGGSTINLLNKVSSINSQNNGQIRQRLRSISPYVSEEVIRVAVDNSPNIFRDEWAAELIINNIDVARNEDFISFLKNKQYPMPTRFVNEIVARSQRDHTARFIMEAEIANISSEKSVLGNMIINHIKQDTIDVDSDSLRAWIKRTDNILNETRIIDTYIDDEQFNRAGQVLNQLSNNVSVYPQHLQQEISTYVSFKTQLISILEDAQHIANLNTNELAFMRSVASNGKGLAQYQAQEILCFFYDECVTYDAHVVNTQTRAAYQEEENDPISEKINKMNISPNPANEVVNIVLPESEEGFLIKITDLSGRIVLSKLSQQSNFVWNTSDVPNGIYVVVAKQGHDFIQSEKIVVQH